MTSTNDKVRSLILAALMVMSVFAGTVAFTGTAAAANNIQVTDGPTNNMPAEGTTVTHELNYTVDDVSDDGNTDTFTITIPQSAEFSGLNQLVVSDANGDVIAATGTSSDEDFDSGPSLQDANGGTDNQVTFAIAPDSSFDTSQVTVDANFDIAWPNVPSDTSGDVVFEVQDSDGSTADLTASDVVTIQNDAPSQGEGANLSESTLIFAGQDAFLDTDLDQGTQNIRLVRSPDSEDDRTTVRPLRVGANGVIQIDTSDLETDNYAIVNANTDTDLVTFEVIVQNLQTEFDDETVDDDENTTLEVTSNRVQDFEIVVEVDGISDDRLLDIFASADARENEDDDIVFTATDGDDVRADFEDVNRGDYEFNFSVNDTTAESTADITVERAGTAELGLNESSYTAETGDTTNMTITFDETDEGFIRIGDEDIGYNVTYEVVDGDEDGMLNVSLNTYDTANNNGGLVLAEDEDGEVNAVNLTDTVTGPLDPGNYDIEVTQQEEDLGSGPDAVGTLAVTERGTTAARPWVTFSDAASDLDRGDDVIAAIEAGEVTQRRNVAEGDFAVVQFEVSGIFGYLEAQNNIANGFGAVDDEDETLPVSLQVEEANPGANQEPDAYDLDDLTYILDDERNMLFVVVPTTGSGIPAEDGDQYNATLEINALDDDDVPGTLNDARTDERVSTTFRVTEREAPLDTNAQDLVEIEQSEEAMVSGTTTIAPGSEITVRVRSVSGAENPFVMSETVNVSSDGTYNATFDFAETPVGTNFTATVSASPGLDGDDEFDGVVVEETTDTPTETDTPTPTETDDSTPTPTETDDSTPTPDDGTDTPTPTETTTTTTPGFGAVVAVLALLGAALLALRRD
jgi:surface glycoprotein (TIGR04207 family)/PGF-CTERM protein